MILKYFISSIILLFSFSSSFAQNKLINNQIRLANSFEARGQLEEAEKIYLELHKNQPSNYQFYQSLNRVLQSQKKYQKSIDLIENQILISKNKVSLYGDLGSAYYVVGDEQKATKIWKDALKLEPNNAFAYRTIANSMIENREIDKAIEILKLGNNVSKNSTIFSYDIANYYSLTMKFEEATKEYCKILLNSPAQLSLVKNKIVAYINSNQATDPTLKTVLDVYEDEGNVVLLKLLAELYMKTNFHEKALETIKIIEQKTTKNGSAFFTFAQQSARMHDYKIAGMAYMNIINNYPNSALFSQAEIGYARSLEADYTFRTSLKYSWKPFVIKDTVGNNDFEKLIIAYQNLANKYPNNKVGYEAEFRIAKIYLYNLNQSLMADSIFHKIIAESKSLQYINEANFSLAEISIEKGDLKSGKILLQKVLDGKMAKPELLSRANYLLAKSIMWEGKFSQALSYFNNVVENPKDENVNDALQYLLLINTFKNDSTNLFSFANADYLVRKKKYNEAALEFKKLAENKNLFLLKDFAAIRYVELLLALNNYEEASIFLEEKSNCDEDNIYKDRFLYLLGSNYYYGLENGVKALIPLTRIFDEYPNSIYFNKVRKIITEINTGEKGNL